MDVGRPKAVWPFLLILVSLFVLVATMPRQWQSVARDPAAKQSLSKAWDDLHVSPRRRASAQGVCGKAPESLIVRFRIASPAEQEASSGTNRWTPAATSAKLATRPIADRAAGIDLPGLPAEAEEPISEGPLIAPLNVVERLPEATSVVGAGPEEAWRGQRFARRLTRPARPASDARDRRPTAFSSATSGERSEQEAESIWCPPESLYAQLGPLTDKRRTAVWAKQAQDEVRRLGEIVAVVAIAEVAAERGDVVLSLRYELAQCGPVALLGVEQQTCQPIHRKQSAVGNRSPRRVDRHIMGPGSGYDESVDEPAGPGPWFYAVRPEKVCTESEGP